MAHRWLAGAAAAWTVGYAAAYFIAIASQRGEIAGWYVALLVAGMVALALAAAGWAVKAALASGLALTLCAAVLALPSIGMLLLPAPAVACCALLVGRFAGEPRHRAAFR